MKYSILFALLAVCMTFGTMINADEPSSPIERIKLDDDAKVWPFSDAVAIDFAKTEKLIFVSGQVGEDSTGELHEETIEEATKYAMDNIGRILSVAGSDWSHVVSVQIFLRDLNDRAAMNEEYRKYFPTNEFPARRTTHSDTGYRIEISATAVTPKVN